MSSLHDRITPARETRRLSKTYFAERLGVTRTAYSHWETGRAKPSTKHIKKIAKLPGIDVNRLIGGIETPEGHMEERSSDNLAV